jgi:hypothetical protein
MPITITNTFVNGDPIIASQHNTNFTDVKNFVDALQAGTNFNAGAINTEDIAASAITADKIATGAVTSAKIQNTVTLTTPVIGVATGTSLNVTGNVISHVVPNTIVGAYTLALTDDGTIIQKNDSSGVAVTIPGDSSVNFAVGTQIVIIQVGTGQTEIVAGAGAVVNGTPGTKLRQQYSSAVCYKRAANHWVVLGDLAA